MDPNLLHWQKVEQEATRARPVSEETIHRPPSYPAGTEVLPDDIMPVQVTVAEVQEIREVPSNPAEQTAAQRFAVNQFGRLGYL